MRPFDLLPSPTQKVLARLEMQDKTERASNLDQSIRLRQVPRETGEFFYMFLTIHAPKFGSHFLGLEIGSSGGYSAIWQGLALQKIGHGRLISLDIDPHKIQVAQENINEAGTAERIQLEVADAKDYLRNSPFDKFQYVFMDCEKEDYLFYYDLLVEKWLQRDSIVIADNVISHAEELAGFLNRVESDGRVAGVIMPIGKGLSLIRRL
ncbi:MAG: O-methyltransferase [Candidatus Hodarchaeales archaeon]